MKYKIILGLTLASISYVSFASGGNIVFSGKIVEPTCTVQNPIKNSDFVISNCQGSFTHNQVDMSFSYSDIDKVINQGTSRPFMLHKMNAMAKKHNMSFNVVSAARKNIPESNNNYIVEMRYY